MARKSFFCLQLGSVSMACGTRSVSDLCPSSYALLPPQLQLIAILPHASSSIEEQQSADLNSPVKAVRTDLWRLGLIAVRSAPDLYFFKCLLLGRDGLLRIRHVLLGAQR
jgi:hypothetical protein